jgi:hypothetical protein
MSEQYNVIFRGALLDGYDLASVQAAFSKVFRMDNSQVEKYFTGQPRILRKKVDHQTAYKFKVALAKFGASVELQRLAPESAPEIEELSLVPIEGEEASQPVDAIKHESATGSTVDTSLFSCPKCQTEQNKRVACINCGIVFDKYLANQSLRNQNSHSLHTVADSNQSTISSQSEAGVENEQVSSAKSFGMKSMIASAMAAVLGALLWMFIAVQFDYELGLIAWLIGGAIGFSAAMFNSRGETAGIICGVLALLSIFGGKYLAYDTFIEEWTQVSSAPEQTSQFRMLYDEEVSMARMYVSQVKDEDSRREFMVNFGYSDSTNVNKVTRDELNFFEQEIAPQLTQIIDQSMTYEQWLKVTVGDDFEPDAETGFDAGTDSFTTFDLVKESLGIIDLVFLFLGVGTAFRLARNE